MSTLLWLCIALAMQLVAQFLVVLGLVRGDPRYSKTAAVLAVAGLAWLLLLAITRW